MMSNRKKIRKKLSRSEKEQIEYAESLAMMWFMHFGQIPAGSESCLDCADYKVGACKPETIRMAYGCVECMERKVSVTGGLMSAGDGDIVFDNV